MAAATSSMTTITAISAVRLCVLPGFIDPLSPQAIPPLRLTETLSDGYHTGIIAFLGELFWYLTGTRGGSTTRSTDRSMKETNMSDRNLVATTWLTACLIGVAAAAVAAEKSRVDFGRDIRPLLSDTCYTCHGPDGESREADLQLDKKEIVFGTLPSDNVAIVPGHADQSELYLRISTDYIDERMPPEDHDKQMTAEEIEETFPPKFDDGYPKGEIEYA